MSKKIIILCCGLPGCGKTSFCQKLSICMGSIPVISTDIIKAIYEGNNEPILKYVSHSAWKYFGECTVDNVLKGYSLFSKSLFAHSLEVAKKMLNSFDLLLLEGMAVTPKCVDEVSKIAIPMLIYMKSNNVQESYKHKLQFRADKTNHWKERANIMTILKNQIETELNIYKPDFEINSIQDSDNKQVQIINKVNSIYNNNNFVYD